MIFRKALLLSFLFFAIKKTCYAQFSTDSVVCKSNIDSLKLEIFILRTENVQLKYDKYLLENFYSIDTSIEVKNYNIGGTIFKDTMHECVFKTQNNKIIREVCFHYVILNTGEMAKSDSLIRFFNSQGQLEYYENWILVNVRRFEEENTGKEIFVKKDLPMLDEYTRIIYDKTGREIRRFYISHGYGNCYFYTYNANGQKEETSNVVISDLEFWDDSIGDVSK